MMRNALLTGAAFSLFAIVSPSFAADVSEVSACYWGPAYVGAFGGLGSSSSDWNGIDDDTAFRPLDIDRSIDASGGYFGGFAGLNYQCDSIVFGIEGDYGIFKTHKKVRLDGSEGLDLTSDTDGLGSIRGRFGYAAGDSLFFVTGGAAFAHGKHIWDDDGGSDIGPVSKNLNLGWVVGAGFEHTLSERFAVRAEGLYYDMGSVSGRASNRLETDRFEVDQTILVGRIGLMYKF